MTFTTYSISGEVGVAQGAGRVTSLTAHELRDAVDRLLDQYLLHVVVDLLMVPSMDSSGIAALIHSQRAARSLGGELRICNVSTQVEHVLDRMNLDRLILTCPSIESAYTD